MPLPTIRQRSPHRWRTTGPMLAVHLLPFLAIFTGVTTKAVVVGVVFYLMRSFGITAGYHRLLAHRAWRTNRVVQAVIVFWGLGAAQKGPLWWSANHRIHHRYTDTDRDPHSPQKGFWWSHIGWVLSGRYSKPALEEVPDLVRYPELRWMDRHEWVGPWAFGIAAFLLAGWPGLLIGFFASTALLWHTTFAVNSISHLMGWRRYATSDSSRNMPVVALLTLGEGWHNNHHHFPASARQGFRWWELDITYLILRLMALVGLARDLREPTPEALASRRLGPGDFDPGRYRQHLARAAGTAPDDEAVEVIEGLASDAVRRRRSVLPSGGSDPGTEATEALPV